MKAIVGEIIVAEAADDQIVRLEGNAYFPPGAVEAGVLQDSATPYTCPWKGVAQYHDVVGGTVLADGAWSYPRVTDYAADRVGVDFSGYVAFDPRQVRVEG